MKNTAEINTEPNIYKLDTRISLLEQSFNKIEKQLDKISDTLDSIIKTASEEKGAKQMKQYLISGLISFGTLCAALELHHVFFK